MKHIISIMLENEAGALSRVSGLFSSRGYNIESLTVAPTNDKGLSHMTIVTHGNDQQLEQIVKQLNKLIDVLKVINLTEEKHIIRDLMLIKLFVKEENQLKIKDLIDEFSCKLLKNKDQHYIIEISGDSKIIDKFLAKVTFAEILEVSRTGISAILDA